MTSINEDAFMTDPAIPLYGVCDGMGGPGKGDLASQLVTEWLPNFIHSTSLGQETTWPFEKKEGLTLAENFLRMAFLQTHQKLIARAQKEEKVGWMGCSGVFLFVNDDKIVCTNVGTCTAYLYRKGKLLALTPVKSLGTHKHWEPFRPAHNVPLNFFGKEGQIDIDSHTERTVKEGDLYLLLSSGMVNSLPLEIITSEIERNINKFNGLSKILVAEAHRLNPSRDLTCVVLMV